MDSRQKARWDKLCQNRDRNEVVQQICDYIDRQRVPRPGFSVQYIPVKTCKDELFGDQERFLQIETILDNYQDYFEIVKKWNQMKGDPDAFLVFLSADNNKYLKRLLMETDDQVVESYKKHLTPILLRLSVQEIQKSIYDINDYLECLRREEAAATKKSPAVVTPPSSPKNSFRKTMKKNSPRSVKKSVAVVSPSSLRKTVKKPNPFARGNIKISPKTRDAIHP
jgi:hypothetical protein